MMMSQRDEGKSQPNVEDDVRTRLQLVMKPTDHIWDSESKHAILRTEELWCVFFTMYIAVYNTCATEFPASPYMSFIMESLDEICYSVLQSSSMGERQWAFLRSKKKKPAQEPVQPGMIGQGYVSDDWKDLRYGTHHARKMGVTGQAGPEGPGPLLKAFQDPMFKSGRYELARALLQGSTLNPGKFLGVAVTLGKRLQKRIKKAVFIHLNTHTCQRENWWPADLGHAGVQTVKRIVGKLKLDTGMQKESMGVLVSILGIQALVLKLNLRPPEPGDLAAGIMLRMRKVPMYTQHPDGDGSVFLEAPCALLEAVERQQKQEAEMMKEMGERQMEEDEDLPAAQDKQADDLAYDLRITELMTTGQQEHSLDNASVEYRTTGAEDTECDMLSVMLDRLSLGKRKMRMGEPTSDIDTDTEPVKKRKVDPAPRESKQEKGVPGKSKETAIEISDDEGVIDLTAMDTSTTEMAAQNEETVLEEQQAAEQEEEMEVEEPAAQKEPREGSVAVPGEGKQARGEPAYGEKKQQISMFREEGEAEVLLTVPKSLDDDMHAVTASLRDQSVVAELKGETWLLHAAKTLTELINKAGSDEIGSVAVHKLLQDKKSLYSQCIAALGIEKPETSPVPRSASSSLDGLFVAAMTSSFASKREAFEKKALTEIESGNELQQCKALCLLCTSRWGQEDIPELKIPEIARIAWMPDGRKQDHLQHCWAKILVRLGVMHPQDPDEGVDTEALAARAGNAELFWAWTCMTMLHLRDPNTRPRWKYYYEVGVEYMIWPGVRDRSTALVFLVAFFLGATDKQPAAKRTVKKIDTRRIKLQLDFVGVPTVQGVPLQYSPDDGSYAAWAMANADRFRNYFAVQHVGRKSLKAGTPLRNDGLPRLVREAATAGQTLERYMKVGDTFRACYLYAMLMRNNGVLRPQRKVRHVGQSMCLYKKEHAGFHCGSLDDSKEHDDTRSYLLYMLTPQEDGQVGFHLGNGFKLVSKLKSGVQLDLFWGQFFKDSEALEKFAQRE